MLPCQHFQIRSTKKNTTSVQAENWWFLQRNKIGVLLKFFWTFKVWRQCYKIYRPQRVQGDNNLIFFYPPKFLVCLFVCLGEDNRKVFSGMEVFRNKSSTCFCWKDSLGCSTGSPGAWQWRWTRRQERAASRRGQQTSLWDSTIQTQASGDNRDLHTPDAAELITLMSFQEYRGFGASSHNVVWLKHKMKLILF